MSRFVEYGNYADGSLKEVVRLNIDAIAAIEMGTGASYATIHLIGGKELTLDPAYISALSRLLEATRIDRDAK